MELPNDVARCPGVFDDDEGEIHWREGCENCARRLCIPTDPAHAVMMAPPAIVTFFCEYHIEWIE